MEALPKKFPVEFKRDVVTVARRCDLSVVEVAVDFGIAEETVRPEAAKARRCARGRQGVDRRRLPASLAGEARIRGALAGALPVGVAQLVQQRTSKSLRAARSDDDDITEVDVADEVGPDANATSPVLARREPGPMATDPDRTDCRGGGDEKAGQILPIEDSDEAPSDAREGSG